MGEARYKAQGQGQGAKQIPDVGRLSTEVTDSEQKRATIPGQTDTFCIGKKIPFLNTIKYILMFKRGRRMDLVPLKKSNLTSARLEQLCDAGARPTLEHHYTPLSRP